MGSKGDEIRAKLKAMSPLQKRMFLESIPAKSRRQEAIPRYPPTDTVPQSYSQRRLWYLYKLDPDSSMYNMPQAAVFHGVLDQASLQQAFEDVIDRHSILRMVFADKNGVPVQMISPRGPGSIRRIDLSQGDPSDVDARGKALSQTIADEPFDLVHGPVVKMTMIELRAQTHVLVINMHHIVSDGWSVGIFVRDFVECYRARTEQRAAQLPPLPIAFADFVQWQNERLSGPLLERQLTFWKGQLAGLQPLALPFDRAPTVHTSAHSDYEIIHIVPELRDRLAAMAKDYECTLFMALLAAFKVVLYRYSGQEDINVGVPVAGRNRIETEHLIGYFTNTTLIRTALSGEPAFCELLKRVRESSLAAFAYDEVPLEKLVELIQPDRDISRNPLFQLMFILQNTARAVIDIPAVRTELLNSYNNTVKFDVLVEFYETERGLIGGIGYRTDLFDQRTLKQFVRAFTEVVTAVALAPTTRINDIPLHTAGPIPLDSFTDILE